MIRMSKLLAFFLALATLLPAADLPTKKFLNLEAIKTMVAAAEAEAQTRNVRVTICVMDDAGNLLFLQKGDRTGFNTVEFAQRKARHAALYGRPSKDSADQLKNGNLQVLVQPNNFPNQGGLPIKVDGQTVGAIAASGAASEVDEAIAQAGIDALLKK